MELIIIKNHKKVLFNGDGYSEGGNHFLHAFRRNIDITYIVHNNEIYGLTTGQTSPTSPHGFPSKSTPKGAIEIPVNPLTLAISQGATFVAQGFAGDIPYLTKLMTRAITHKGFSLLNILQPCVTFNKVCTYEFYRKWIYKLEDEGWKENNKFLALKKAASVDKKIPIGVFYEEERASYHQGLPQIKKEPLLKQRLKVDITPLFKSFL